LIEWNTKITDCEKNGFFNDFSEDEKNIKKQYIEKTSGNIEKNYKQKLFFEKNKKNIIIGIIIFIGISVLIGSMIGNFTKSKSTKGFPPEKVVETFYNSISKLDHMTMSDCVEKNAGKDKINEVMNLYVISRQIMAYSQKSNVVLTDEWIKSGMKIVEKPQYIFGIIDLIISEEKPIPEPVYIVKYQKWEPYFDDNKNTGVQNKNFNVIDRVYLHYNSKYWLIYKIDNLENSEIKN
jgi:hypothetical protein